MSNLFGKSSGLHFHDNKDILDAAATEIVTVDDVQTLTNKTLTTPDINGPDINGGTLDNAPVGDTTPSTGSFTNLSAESIDEALKSRPDLTFDEIMNLFSGVTEGEEGPWDVVELSDIAADASTYGDNGYGVDSVKVTDTGVEVGETFGSFSKIDEDVQIFILGDSGTFYRVVLKFVSTNTQIRLHPNHGDVSADFTGTHLVVVCKEDTANKTTGTQTRPEIFLGNAVNTVAEIEAVIGGTAPQDGAINAGYWDGPTWESQLLGDAPHGTNSITCRLNRKYITTLSLYVLNSVGAYVEYTLGSANSSLGYARTGANNSVLINTVQSWSTLGYASEADMLDNSAVKVVYTHDARRARPNVNVGNIEYSHEVIFYRNSNNSARGAALVQELIGSVPTASAAVDTSNTSIISYEWDDDGLGIYDDSTIKHNVIAPSSSSPNAVKIQFGLHGNGTTWDLILKGQEIVFDSDWGDVGEILVGDNVTTTTDDNGNVVIRGTWKVPTGIAQVT